MYKENVLSAIFVQCHNTGCVAKLAKAYNWMQLVVSLNIPTLLPVALHCCTFVVWLSKLARGSEYCCQELLCI